MTLVIESENGKHHYIEFDGTVDYDEVCRGDEFLNLEPCGLNINSVYVSNGNRLRKVMYWKMSNHYRNAIFKEVTANA